MRIIHVLADGKRVDDITGHVIRVEKDNPLHEIIGRISRKVSDKKKLDGEKLQEV